MIVDASGDEEAVAAAIGAAVDARLGVGRVAR
jgi:hypothetical protein